MSSIDLVASAIEVRRHAYAPYSRFPVGAALLCRNGRVFTGCNVENLSFGLTCCAERNAIFAAIALGERDFVKIVIVADSREPVTPCGACRQVMAEFSENLEIESVNLQGLRFVSNVAELLPRAKAGILDAESST